MPQEGAEAGTEVRAEPEAKTVAIHGWGCTPTGDLPAAAVSSGEPTRQPWAPAVHKGWRRTALYSILVLLMVIVFLNLALTLWIISVLQLNFSGVGPVQIVAGGIKLNGHAWIMDQLVASTISSKPAQPITLHAHRNFSVHVSEPSHAEAAKLLIKRDRVECTGQSFQINDPRGFGIFHASRDEVKVFADALTVTGPGGVSVKSGLQAPLVKAPPGSNLHLESSTRRLDLRAPQSIHLESRAGAIEITSHADIKLVSVVGAIRIDAPNIVLGNLTEAQPIDKPSKVFKTRKVYQMCACATGRLFLAAPDSPCEAREDDVDLCR